VRSDGHPLYHFCVCVDDADMRITHVIRGDDHLANTPKHVALFRALDVPIPRFAHLGMILGTDKKKLSKRHGAAAVEELRDEGIFPEALLNFLALLGWAPGGDREILTREEMEKEFSLDRVGASPSVFDPEKLLWMNAQYMTQLAEKLRSAPHAQAAQIAANMAGISAQQLTAEVAVKAIWLHRTRARTTVEMGRALSTYAADPTEYDADGMKKQVKPETPGLLEKLLERLETLSDWTTNSLERTLRAIADESGVPAAKLIHPTRLALTGMTVGAPLFDVVELLGKETALRRLRRFLEKITTQTQA
ncbi:MAG: glutamate--tRNA ligase, partial [Thermoanaerobaculia bacterium]